jgi:hypothetical protein
MLISMGSGTGCVNLYPVLLICHQIGMCSTGLGCLCDEIDRTTQEVATVTCTDETKAIPQARTLFVSAKELLLVLSSN